MDPVVDRCSSQRLIHERLRSTVRGCGVGGLYASREYWCALVLGKVEALATRLYPGEGCRTGRRRVAARRGCRYMHGRRKHTVSICVYVCLGECGCGVGGWVGWVGDGVEDGFWRVPIRTHGSSGKDAAVGGGTVCPGEGIRKRLWGRRAVCVPRIFVCTRAQQSGGTCEAAVRTRREQDRQAKGSCRTRL